MITLSCPRGVSSYTPSGLLGSVSVPPAPLALFKFELGLFMHGVNSSILFLANSYVVSLLNLRLISSRDMPWFARD